MNEFQELWWHQARSDHGVFLLLRHRGVAECHQLHYLQMASEKIGKAYFWQRGVPPPAKHTVFVQFVRCLGHVSFEHRDRVAGFFGFKRPRDFQNWLRIILPVAHELERLAPSLANDGPNPEYPWPHNQPTNAPVNYDFSNSVSLLSPAGRSLLQATQILIERFPEYASV
jgi:hypothetical protein